jgi:hypothetical protein
MISSNDYRDEYRKIVAGDDGKFVIGLIYNPKTEHVAKTYKIIGARIYDKKTRTYTDRSISSVLKDKGDIVGVVSDMDIGRLLIRGNYNCYKLPKLDIHGNLIAKGSDVIVDEYKNKGIECWVVTDVFGRLYLLNKGVATTIDALNGPKGTHTKLNSLLNQNDLDELKNNRIYI